MSSGVASSPAERSSGSRPPRSSRMKRRMPGLRVASRSADCAGRASAARGACRDRLGDDLRERPRALARIGAAELLASDWNECRATACSKSVIVGK